MENKRMTWDEIVAKYPDQWVGLTDVERDGADVVSAVVKYSDKDADELLGLQIEGKVYSIYTTPENLMWNLPLGALMTNVEETLNEIHHALHEDN